MQEGGDSNTAEQLVGVIYQLILNQEMFCTTSGFTSVVQGRFGPAAARLV